GGYAAPVKGYSGNPRFTTIDSGLDEFLLSLGRINYQLGSHPSTLQRIVATRFGLERRLWELKKVYGPDKDIGAANAALLELDVRKDEASPDWSLRICRGIVHSSWAATR